MRNRTSQAFLVALLSVTLAGRLWAQETLLENGSFETDELGQLSMWSMDAYAHTEEAVRFFVTKSEKHSGERSFVIANLQPNDARAVQWVRVKPDTHYRLSCWILAQDVVTDGIGANISVLGSTRAAGDLRNTGGWQYVELFGRTGPTQRSVGVLVRLGFYGSLAKGIALFDDVAFEELPAAPLDVPEQDVVDFAENDKAKLPLVGVSLKVEKQEGWPRGFVPDWLLYAVAGGLLAAVVGLTAGLVSASRRARPLPIAMAAFSAPDEADETPKPDRRAEKRTRKRAEKREARSLGKPAGRAAEKPEPEAAVRAPKAAPPPAPPSKPFAGVERRKSARYPFRADVTVTKIGSGGRVDLIHFQGGNLSDGGIFLGGGGDPSMFGVKEPVRLEFSSAGKLVSLGKAEVVRVHLPAGRRRKVEQSGFGLRFTTSGQVVQGVRRRLMEGEFPA